jgi:hypothetical protein
VYGVKGFKGKRDVSNMDKAIEVLCKELKLVYDENEALRIRDAMRQDSGTEIEGLKVKHGVEIEGLKVKHGTEIEGLRLQHEKVMTETFVKPINVLALPLSMSVGPYPFPKTSSHRP